MNKTIIFLLAGLTILSTSSSAELSVIDQQMDRYVQTQGISADNLSLTQQAPAPALTGTMWAGRAGRPRQEFGFGVERYAYGYRELVAGEKFMSTRGTYRGLFASYTFRPVDIDTLSDWVLDVFRAELRYATANVDYTGTGTFPGLKDAMYEIRGVLGKEYDVTRTLLVSPYAGLGWRYLHNALDMSQPGGYARESTYLYLPLGMQVYQRLPGAWGIGMGLEYDYLIQGWQRSHLEDIDPKLDPMTNRQDKGFGFRGSLKVVKELRMVRLSIEPFYRYWKIERSSIEPVTVAGQLTGWVANEPENTTQEVGVRLGAEF
ncbi:MAG: hypothetical protein HQL17_05400 [Candidatus Omnitrophica bacterium]|nr:hypothetical protein [Candidatus Omnitrophota bacterium]